MPGTTASGVPYALPEDPLSQWPATSRGVAEKVEASMPLGAIIAYGGSTAPAGWHLCDGTAHNSAALTALIGSATTPDLRGRFVVAAGGGYSRGDTGGTASVTLTTAQMPSHSHGGKTADEDATHGHTGITSDAGSHVHAATREEVGGADPSNTNDGARNATGLPFTLTGAAGLHNHAFSTTVQNATHRHVIQPEGGGSAHENRPPYYALTYIIKKA